MMFGLPKFLLLQEFVSLSGSALDQWQVLEPALQLPQEIHSLRTPRHQLYVF
jgi:hypothetical protein